MTAVMKGVRILEVAEHTFVPAASAVLADYGAEVIKIEHVERGDAMRGLASSGTVNLGGGVHVLLEHSNRGKQSLALDLTSEDGLDILYKLAATSDVFLTNKLPSVRTKLKIDVDEIRGGQPGHHLRARAPARASGGPTPTRARTTRWPTGTGPASPWARSRPTRTTCPPPPAPAFGDSIGAMTIAGGIMGALFHREKTGEATTVDVSLLSTGLWSMGAALALSLQLDVPWAPPPKGGSPSGNPLVANYRTKDDRYVALCCLQPGKYWPEAVPAPRRAGAGRRRALQRRGDDPGQRRRGVRAPGRRLRRAHPRRVAGAAGRLQRAVDGGAEHPRGGRGPAVGRQRLRQPSARPPTACAFKLATVPVQFDGEPAQAKRAPEFNEHGDAILEGLGLDWDTIVDLKVRGVVA